MEQPNIGIQTSGIRSSFCEESTLAQTTNQVDQSPSARSFFSNKSSQSLNAMVKPPSARSSFSGRPIRTVPLMPFSVAKSLKPVAPTFPSDAPTNHRKDKR